ncbi:Calmodulin binding protein PICBP [Arabidopsis thaliana]
MEDNEKNQTLPEETRKEEEEEELKEDTSVDGEKMELYQTEAVELLGEVIDGISLEESQDQNLNNEETRQKSETLQVSKVRIDRWSNLKRAILLRRFVKALENVRKFNPREPRFLPPNPEVEAEKVNLRHQETQNKKNGDEWMVDNALQGVVSKLTPARKLKVQLLVQAFESLSATGN